MDYSRLPLPSPAPFHTIDCGASKGTPTRIFNLSSRPVLRNGRELCAGPVVVWRIISPSAAHCWLFAFDVGTTIFPFHSTSKPNKDLLSLVSLLNSQIHARRERKRRTRMGLHIFRVSFLSLDVCVCESECSMAFLVLHKPAPNTDTAVLHSSVLHCRKAIIFIQHWMSFEYTIRGKTEHSERMERAP